MSVGGIGSGASQGGAGVPALSAEQAVASAQLGMLAQSMDMAVQLNAMLLQSLQAGGPAGVGTSVDTYA